MELRQGAGTPPQARNNGLPLRGWPQVTSAILLWRARSSHCPPPTLILFSQTCRLLPTHFVPVKTLRGPCWPDPVTSSFSPCLPNCPEALGSGSCSLLVTLCSRWLPSSASSTQISMGFHLQLLGLSYLPSIFSKHSPPRPTLLFGSSPLSSPPLAPPIVQAPLFWFATPVLPLVFSALMLSGLRVPAIPNAAGILWLMFDMI